MDGSKSSKHFLEPCIDHLIVYDGWKERHLQLGRIWTTDGFHSFDDLLRSCGSIIVQ